MFKPEQYSTENGIIFNKMFKDTISLVNMLYFSCKKKVGDRQYEEGSSF